jgi:myo-inositol-1(or 4)-monophosphatase
VDTQNDFLAIAEATARVAGAILLERFHGPAQGVTTKSSATDPVSDADRAAEDAILRALTEARPGDGVVSEEGGGSSSRTGLRWIIDPLDGTVNFLFGIPHWCVSIAVEDEDGWLAGAVYDPNRDEMFSAGRGGGATLNGGRLRFGGKSDISQALVGTGFSYDSRARALQAEVIVRLLPRVRDIRRAGSAALDLAWCAAGRLDGFFEAEMHVWDRAAGELLVAEAGGLTTPLEPPSGNGLGVIASNPELHEDLCALVLG